MDHRILYEILSRKLDENDEQFDSDEDTLNLQRAIMVTLEAEVEPSNAHYSINDNRFSRERNRLSDFSQKYRNNSEQDDTKQSLLQNQTKT